MEIVLKIFRRPRRCIILFFYFICILPNLQSGKNVHDDESPVYSIWNGSCTVITEKKEARLSGQHR